MNECPGHPCEDAADDFPHAGIGDTFFCDGSCQAPPPARLPRIYYDSRDA